MSIMLPLLRSGLVVVKAILAEKKRPVMHPIRSRLQDVKEHSGASEAVLCDKRGLYVQIAGPSGVNVFPTHQSHALDLGAGDNNQINWPPKYKLEKFDIIETVKRKVRDIRQLRHKT